VASAPLHSRLESVRLAAADDDSVSELCGFLQKIAESLGAAGSARAACLQVCAHEGALEALCSLLRPSLAEPHEGAAAQRAAAQVLQLLAEEASEAEAAALGAAGAGEALLGALSREAGGVQASCARALAQLAARGLPLSLGEAEARHLSRLLSGDAASATRLQAASLLERCMTPALAAQAARAGLAQALVEALRPPLLALSPADEARGGAFCAAASALVSALARCGGEPLRAALCPAVPELVQRLQKESTPAGHEGARGAARGSR